MLHPRYRIIKVTQIKLTHDMTKIETYISITHIADEFQKFVVTWFGSMELT